MGMNRHLKILLAPEYSESPSGGARHFFYRLLSIHYRNQIDTAVLIEKFQADETTIRKCHDAGVPLYTIPNRKNQHNSSLLSLLKEITYFYKALRKYRPNLVCISNKNPGINLSIFFFPVRIIFFMHTYPFFEMPLIQKLIIWFIAKYLINDRKKIVTVSQYSAMKISRMMGVSTEFIEVIYNQWNEIVEQQSLNSQPVVLTVGHVVEYKNPHLWLRVAQKVIEQNGSARFIWVGDGAMLTLMRDQVIQLNLNNNISFPGFSDQVGNFYSQSCIYFQPSIIESHGKCVVEAMGYGLPCIVSNVGGMPESVINGETGFICEPNDVEGFSQKILLCLENKEMAENLGSNGMARAKKMFSPELQEKKILALYQK